MSKLSATLDDHSYDDPTSDPLGAGPRPVEVRRNGGLAAAIGGLASAVAIAYLARATSSGSWLDWALVLVMGAIGAAYLTAFVDARTPLLVADDQGVRIRLGSSWRGVPWSEIDHVEHQPRQGLFHDGRLVLVAQDPVEVFGDLEASGRRQARLADRLYGAPLAIPLALSTRVAGHDGDLTGALQLLADDPDQVVEVVTEDLEAWDDVDDELAVEDEIEDELDDELEVEHDDHDEHRPLLHDPRPALARAIGFVATRMRLTPSSETDETTAAPEPTVALSPLVASASPIPLRDPVTGSRFDAAYETEGGAALARDHAEHDDETRGDLPEARELRRPGSVDLVEDTVVWSDRVSPISREGDAVAPLVIDAESLGLSSEPVDDPVVGPELAAARTRLSLTVDQLAERTRIRPHVIESIEVDDFAPCGGDFYARGHLRTLARVLGVDAAPLLAAYDERYADAPIDARRVFEAELSTGVDGPIRGTRGGPNWSVLVAAVMALVLAWSIARLIMDSPVELHSQPILNGSGGAGSQAKLAPPVPVKLDASTGGAHVVVRDGAGEIVFNGDLAYGDTKVLQASPPVRVQSSDGALKLTVDGEDRGPLGADGQPAQNTFAAAD